MATIQALYTDFKYLRPSTKDIAEHFRAIGVSITGLMVNPLFKDGELLAKGAEVVKRVNKEMAKMLHINYCRRVTTVKPSGTATILLGGTGSGCHPPHDTKYLRRVRTNEQGEDWKALKDTPLAKYENGEYIISFPVELDESVKTKHDYSALEHIKFIGKIKHFWVNKGVSEFNDEPLVPNNVSATVLVKEDEWEQVAVATYLNSHLYGGLSFLPKYEESYPNLPFTSLTTKEEQEEFDAIKEYLEHNTIDFQAIFSNKAVANVTDFTAVACSGGACEIK